MSEENKELESVTEEVTETVEEAVTEETTEEIIEETAEAVEVADEEAVQEVTENSDEEAATEETEAEEGTVLDGEAVSDEEYVEGELTEAEESKKNSKTAIISVVIAAVVLVAAVAVYFLIGRSNPYAKDYVDVSGKTIEQIADESGLEFTEFLEMYDLPEDMPKTTSENAAYYNIPAAKYAEMMGMDFASIKEILGWDDTITEETTIGDAFDKTTIGKRVGEDQVEAFKAEYELDDSITADTLWVEIRNIVDTKLKEQTEAQKAEEEAAENADSDEAESAETEGESAEAPAEDAEAEGSEEAAPEAEENAETKTVE